MTERAELTSGRTSRAGHGNDVRLGASVCVVYLGLMALVLWGLYA